jgi:hypothetical protein
MKASNIINLKIKIYFYILFLIPITISAQKKSGYTYLGGVAYFKNNANVFGGKIGSGVYEKAASFGFGVEILMKDKRASLPLYLDFKKYLSQKDDCPYISLNPGYWITNYQIKANNVQLTQRGGFYFSGGIGIMSKKSNPDINIELNFTLFQTRVITNVGNNKNVSISHPGFIGLRAGILLN